jgi:hypothetical protein
MTPSEEPVRQGEEAMSSRTVVVSYGALLTAVLGVTVLFAGRLLRYGLGEWAIAFVYMTGGLLAAVVSFRFFEFSRAFEGTPDGVRWRIAGAVVAALVVAAGGGAYEKYVRAPDGFACRLRFLDADGTARRLTGSVSLLLGTEYRRVELRNDALTMFDGIPQERHGGRATVFLDCMDYDVISGQQDVILDDLVTVRVRPITRAGRCPYAGALAVCSRATQTTHALLPYELAERADEACRAYDAEHPVKVTDDCEWRLDQGLSTRVAPLAGQPIWCHCSLLGAVGE